MRRLITLAGLLVVLAGMLGVSGCFSSPLLFNVVIDPPAISPNEESVRNEARLQYSLGNRADVKITLLGPNGFSQLLRDQTRAPGNYEIRFNGAVGTEEQQRVIPDGHYTFVVEAKDSNGRTAEQRANLAVEDADTVPPEIRDVSANLDTISPNGDGIDDEMTLSFALSKKATTMLFLTRDDDGSYYMLYAPKEMEGLHAYLFDGHDNGEKLLVDGHYTFHIRAWDKAGNVSEAARPITIDQGGIPRLDITEAKFSPTAVPLGGTVHVRITVKNTGNAVVRSNPADGIGPPPGTAYTTDQSFATWQDDKRTPLYYERPGTWRVGISWTNAPPPPVPIRWSLGKDLSPGEETTITGDVQVLQRTREIYFSAWVVQEGVGFPGEGRAQTKVTISY
ncbi:MAG: Ig-like domain-containing protein [Bacteroidetes bacterium]|nr:Ig-like domain-containing protein [Bacteroidota bacterium]MCL5025122.1 Ig-like domain-containing protein [Chloroflexota bacterium]